ncbi:MAG TPA: DUF3820 family protein [Cytophagales bacterium]|nr:DUF3820 family protein [Cytophagales bacterium]
MIDQLNNREYLEKFIKMRMPFGKYKDWLVLDLPESYLVWFKQKGFPKGELGNMIGLSYEIKLNGLEYLFKPIKNKKK